MQKHPFYGLVFIQSCMYFLLCVYPLLLRLKYSYLLLDGYDLFHTYLLKFFELERFVLVWPCQPEQILSFPELVPLSSNFLCCVCQLPEEVGLSLCSYSYISTEFGSWQPARAAL